MSCRVAPRHGVSQGMKPDLDKDGNQILLKDGSPKMVPKIRLCDDYRRNMSNEHLQRLFETVSLCRFTYMASVADSLVAQCRASGEAIPKLCLHSFFSFFVPPHRGHSHR